MKGESLVLGGLAILCGCLVLLAPAACTMRSNELIAEAVRNGSNPIDAYCALGSGPSATVCIMRAAQHPASAPR